MIIRVEYDRVMYLIYTPSSSSLEEDGACIRFMTWLLTTLYYVSDCVIYLLHTPSSSILAEKDVCSKYMTQSLTIFPLIVLLIMIVVIDVFNTHTILFQIEGGR